jgi:uncharacterized membrane protein
MSGGKTALGLEANIGAMACYLANLIPCCVPLGLVYSIIVIVQDKTNKLARFHAFQSIILSVVGVIVGILINVFLQISFNAGGIISMLFGLIGGISGLVGLVIFVAIIYTAIKAYQGEIFKLPVIGDMADKWSN